MRTILSVIYVLFTMSTLSYSQDSVNNLNKLKYLLGHWKGEGSGKPGEGGGYFSFEYDLDKNIVIRKKHVGMLLNFMTAKKILWD